MTAADVLNLLMGRVPTELLQRGIARECQELIVEGPHVALGDQETQGDGDLKGLAAHRARDVDHGQGVRKSNELLPVLRDKGLPLGLNRLILGLMPEVGG
jgi:hypothetical protein